MTDVPTADAGAGTLSEGIYRDGIVALKGALPTEWADQMLADFETLYAEAEQADRASGPHGGNGRVPRGPGADARRYYFAVHPQRLRGFQDLVTHRGLDAVCREVLGEDYQFVEVGFDVALPGAVRQPLHRDFPVPDETKATGRLSSLAVNATCVDVTPEMGPLEIVPGSQFDDDAEFDQGMRVPPPLYDRYSDRVQPRLAKRGDVSVRTGLTIHRGTPNTSSQARPVLIVGVMGNDFPTFADHDLTMTRDYFEALPDQLKAHLRRCEISDGLDRIVQDYVLDFLLEEG
ncbi:MAG: phytanoyl-CoA dioxygenase family protein [Actinobacteria bacterium]|nr:phytanoyl-CoA dioxygenase family protein [Actinomycetota bacterium]